MPRAASNSRMPAGFSAVTAGNGAGDQGEDTHRRHQHNQIHKPHNHLVEALEETQERLRLFPTDLNEANTQENGKEHHLQHVPIVGGGGEKVLRNHVHERLQGNSLTGGFRLLRASRDIILIDLLKPVSHLFGDPVAGLDDIDQDQPDADRDRRGRHVDCNRFSTDARELLQVRQ